MIIFKKYFFYLIIILLLTLLIFGYLSNKNSSQSKKNEIYTLTQQLKSRTNQLSKIQKNLFQEEKNINNLINQYEIVFKKIFEDQKLFNDYLFSKYTTNDILFNGNSKAVGTAFIDFFNKDRNIFLATYDGIFASAEIQNLKQFKKINSNINSLIKYDKFYYHEQYGIKDILINDDNLYVSYIGKRKDNCYDLKIIKSRLNKNYLDFELFFQTSNCVDVNNDHDYWAHQGAGGRIFQSDDSNILFTTGDFRNRPLAQDPNSDFGKILRINTQNKKVDLISLGHRNPQGLYYSKKFDFILSTEHGPKGGDEININVHPFLKVKNFGWPISSYGEHYSKNNSEKNPKRSTIK